MGLFDKIKQAVGGAQKKLPENMNSVSEVKVKAQELAQQHGSKIDTAAEKLKTALPGDKGDKAIDGVRGKIDQFAKKK